MIGEENCHSKTSLLLPPKPEEPLDSECCGSGCSPCVFDIYKEKLKRWEKDCDDRESGESTSAKEIITPYEYENFVIDAIIKDCLSCKIISFKRADIEHETFSFDKRKFPVKLGQHVVIKISEKTRQYTVLDVRKDGSFTIIFKIYETGMLTPLVDNLVLGSKVFMRGPFGKEFLYKPNTYSTLFMMAGGTGIAPFYRVIEKVLEDDNDETRVVVLYACRSENEVLLLDKMKEWSRSWNFQVKYFLSKVENEKKAKHLYYGANVTCGKISKTVIENLLLDVKIKNNLYFICGTKSFDKDMLNYLKAIGIHEEKINLF